MKFNENMKKHIAGMFDMVESYMEDNGLTRMEIFSILNVLVHDIGIDAMDRVVALLHKEKNILN